MTSLLHGQCVSISKVADLDNAGIARTNFLDRDLANQIGKKVALGSDLLFIGNDVAESFKKREYLLILHGVLPCGSKTTLTITGIKPYVDVRVLKDETEEQCTTRMKRYVMLIDDDNANIEKLEFKTGKDFLYYDHEEHLYARVHFNSLKIRADFMSVCQQRDIKTYSNDKSTYYRVVAREYEINLSGWNVLRNYSRDYRSESKAMYVFTIDIKDIEPVVDEQALVATARDHGVDPAVVKYERMIIASFDIEMIPAKPDRFPDADKNPNDSIFMICMTYHYVKRNDSILNVCLTLKETDPLDGVYVVHCKTEACLLWAFAHFMKFMQPDFITEFNGGGFDWRNIITKAMHLNVISYFLEDMSLMKLMHWEKSTSMLNRFHRETRIKINGATADSISKGLKMQGFVSFDTLIVFKQLEPNADSHKLNECLRRCNLGSKDDLDVQEMFRIYREGTKEEMRLVAHYCFIDTFKLQQLLLKKNVIQDRREVANLSYTSLHDNFCFAGGSRMRNLLMNRGANLGYFFDTQYRPEIEDPDAKFPGAYVVPPIKGIVKPMLRIDEFADLNKIEYDDKMLKQGYKFVKKNFERMYHSDKPVKSKYPFIQQYVEYVNVNRTQYPISGLDFASLYPSIIMTYNISPEKLIIDEAYASELIEQGRDLQFVSFPFCGKMMNAWFVRHGNVEDDYSICGKLLIELFARRAAIKKVLKHLGEQIFDMEMEMKAYADSPSEYPRLAEYNEVMFDHICADSKQKAVKVFMNTLYGEMGNFLSCICAVQVAGSVTTMGRYNLRLIKSYVEEKLSMTVYYGDTDSLYVSCNAAHFIEDDREYFTGKIDKVSYGTKLVEETFKQIEVARDLVNEHLITNNGSKFLKMAYEEVLYPAAFLSKKKYYGVPHEENVDFYPRKLFLRGLEIVKRGASGVLKDVINEVLREVMDLKTTRDIIDIIKEAIERVFNTNWSIDAFAKTKVYRPDKRNVSVITMMNRYRAINYPTIPEPNVRFKYVICKYYPWEYDVEGRQTAHTIGDRMELLERVHDEGLDIDLEYYFDNELTGQLARLITFCKEFDHVEQVTTAIDTETMSEIEVDAILKENYNRSEDALFKAAKKFIAQLAKHYSKPFVNKRGLFTHTWSEVCGFISARHDIQSKHMSVPVAIVLNIFANPKCAKNLDEYLLTWMTTHIAKKYRTTLGADQEQALEAGVKMISKYIVSNKLKDVLTNCLRIWKEQVVRYIRQEYDYELICKNNLPYDTMWDVLTRQELEAILSYHELFPAITADQAMDIIDLISRAIGEVLPLSSFE